MQDYNIHTHSVLRLDFDLCLDILTRNASVCMLQDILLEYRKANRLLYEKQGIIEGKNKDIFVMGKDLQIQDIPNIEFLKTDYSNKYLCIKEALVNASFESISQTTEDFMK